MKIKHVVLACTVSLLVSCQLFESQVERRERYIVDAVDSCRHLDDQSTEEQKEESMNLAQQAIEYVTSIAAIELEEDQLNQLYLYLNYINTDDCDGLNAQLRLVIPMLVRALREESGVRELAMVETQVDFDKEYEKSRQECSDEGGEWIVSRKWDGKSFYGHIMWCLESESLAKDPSREVRLLPYYINVIYSAKVHKLIGFARSETASR